MNKSDIHHEETAGRGMFFIGEKADAQASLTYHRWKGDKAVNVDHTEVEKAHRGEDVGLHLLEQFAEWARKNQLNVSATCPFAVAMFKRHPEMTKGIEVAYDEKL